MCMNVRTTSPDHPCCIQRPVKYLSSHKVLEVDKVTSVDTTCCHEGVSRVSLKRDCLLSILSNGAIIDVLVIGDPMAFYKRLDD